jgi:hypothetical protein
MAQDILKRLGETQYPRKDMAEINHHHYYDHEVSQVISGEPLP